MPARSMAFLQTRSRGVQQASGSADACLPAQLGRELQHVPALAEGLSAPAKVEP